MERAADLAGDYSYLLGFIEGGQERLDGSADTLAGVEADDDAMTLTVTMSAPYSNFPAVAGFQLFFPVPTEAITAGENWENEVMFGNGPYKMETARTDQEIVLVKNDEWNGDFNQDTWDDRLDSITFKTSADPDTSYNSFEAGEGNNANIPPARVADAEAAYQNTLDVEIIGSYHWVFDTTEGVLAGPENLKLRQAISAAIDREEINEAVYNGSRTTSTGITPDGIPGFAPTCATTAPTTRPRPRPSTTSGSPRAGRSPSRSRCSSTPTRATSPSPRSWSTTSRPSASKLSLSR